LDKGHSEAGSLIERLYGSDALTISPGVSPKTRLLALTVWPLCIYRPHTTCRPLEMRARLLRKMIKGKMVSVLTSMVDPLRFPGGEIVDLYSQRWEIELGYRAIKQRLLGGEYTLRSKTPEMIAQELWGVLLGYNLLRYQMVLMSRQCPGVYPCEMSFTACSWAILGLLHGTSLNHPGNLPGFLRDLQASAARYVLPHRRPDRWFPRAVVGHAVKSTHRRHLVRIETRTGPHVHWGICQ
jgi:Transposase DDE domain